MVYGQGANAAPARMSSVPSCLCSLHWRDEPRASRRNACPQKHKQDSHDYIVMSDMTLKADQEKQGRTQPSDIAWAAGYVGSSKLWKPRPIHGLSGAQTTGGRRLRGGIEPQAARDACAIARIFDGEKEAKLIALACSKRPKGRARWTLRLLENKVVELGIVDRASDSTIGRALKKTLFSPIAASTGSSRRRPTARS